jgi:hypothetical protein
MEAHEIIRFLCHCQLCPQDIFDNNHSLHDRNNTNYEYSTKPFQTSHVTVRTISFVCWPYASPPKFRRLLVTPPHDEVLATRPDPQEQQRILQLRREHIQESKTSTYAIVAKCLE